VRERFDVIVVGGGPAGSTTATLLTKQGYSVLLLEQEKFPRYHIGESFVPGIMPILDALDVTEEMLQHRFVVKKGATLVWGQEREPWSIRFGEASPLDYTIHVTRAEFDYVLLHNARRHGVIVREEATVTDFLFEQGRCTGVTYTFGKSTQELTATARFVIDASGQRALLARKLGLIEYDEQLRNIAVWTYYQGGNRFTGDEAGNILLENVKGGWLWVIPLHDGTQSVGWVMPAGEAQGRQQLEAMLLQRISESRDVRSMLAPAQRVSGFRTARDWSYVSKRFFGPGFLLTGDAAGFIDPLFSTGVFLAMNAARLAADAVANIFQDSQREIECLEQYEAGYKKFLNTLISFVHYFYDANKQKEEYWNHAQKLVDPIQQMTSRQDFIYLIAGLEGLITLGDPDAESKLRDLQRLIEQQANSQQASV
jgi:FAD-dependent halogenase